jgi:hypothetical protein
MVSFKDLNVQAISDEAKTDIRGGTGVTNSTTIGMLFV